MKKPSPTHIGSAAVTSCCKIDQPAPWSANSRQNKNSLFRGLKTGIACLAAIAATSLVCLGALPGVPADAGFAAVSGTFYVNSNSPHISAGNSEHPSVDIAANGNIIVGWEDDGSEFEDFEAIWTLFGPTGIPLIPQTVQTNRSDQGAVTTFTSITNNYLSFFRSDNTPIGGYTGWGPRHVRANRYGNGLGFGAIDWEIGLEVAELLALNAAENGEDMPCVQLLNNDGTPLRPGPIVGITNLGILTLAEADVTPSGDVRLADFGYLSSGNVVIVAESRQVDDQAMTGQISGKVPGYRIVTPAGIQVHAFTNVSSEALGGNIGRGLGVTSNGFAVRWDQDGGAGAQIRLFDNAGNPTTADISLTNLTGHPEVGQGADGGGVGFHGNGTDAYVLVNPGNGTPWVTVINADGTLRWSRKVQDDADPISLATGDMDGAIDDLGRVIVVFSGVVTNNSDNTVVSSLVQARMFDRNGNPLGPRFCVSETENQAANSANVWTDLPTGDKATDSACVAWRGNNVIVAWVSRNDPAITVGTPIISARILAAPITITSASRTGTTMTLNWTGGKSPYSVQRRSPVTGSWSTVASGITGNSTTDTFASGEAYYRVLCPN